MGKFIYFQKKSLVPLRNRVFEKLAIYIPKLNKTHRIYTKKNTEIYPKKSQVKICPKKSLLVAEGEPTVFFYSQFYDFPNFVL